MRLDQLHEVKLWHQRHRGECPLEGHAWEVVLTLWIAAWAGIPAAVLVHSGWAVTVGAFLLFLPRVYVALRRRLQSARRLRCDWLIVVGP